MWYILCLAGLVLHQSYLRACILEFNKASITDTEIVNAILPPRPPSVINCIKNIKKIEGYQEKTSLDLAENNIGLKGAAEILRFILSSEGLSNLKKLDLSYNRIRDLREHEEYDDFERLLKQLLERKSFEKIDLSVNYLGYNWLKYITKEFDKELREKIIYA